MLGTRQGPPSRSGRSILALSTLALLAFAWIPLSAQAGVPEYDEALPNATGKNTIPNRSEPRGNSSKADGGGSTAKGQDSQDSSEAGGAGGDSSSKPGGGSNAAKDGGTGQQQGSRGQGADGGSQPADVTGANPASTESDDDGSSPLPAILIAIAVLAAISIGAVVIRQRRQGGEGGSGTPVSPGTN